MQGGLYLRVSQNWVHNILSHRCPPLIAGPGTLETVAEAVKSRMPVLIVEGSGRAADAISYAWRLLHDDSPKARDHNRAGLRQKLRKLFPVGKDKGGNKEEPEQWDERLRKKTKVVLEIVLSKDSLSIFEMTRSDVENTVDRALLDAIIRALRVKPLDEQMLKDVPESDPR